MDDNRIVFFASLAAEDEEDDDDDGDGALDFVRCFRNILAFLCSHTAWLGMGHLFPAPIPCTRVSNIQYIHIRHTKHTWFYMYLQYIHTYMVSYEHTYIYMST